MNFTKAIRPITSCYHVLRGIGSDRELSEHNLTVADWHEARRCLALLGCPGNMTTTIYKNVSEFFNKFGFIVSLVGNGYEIRTPEVSKGE